MTFSKIAWLGSVGLMAGALFFQYGLNMAPCQLCIYQRAPHVIVIMLGIIAIWKNIRVLFPIFGILMLVGAAIAMFHVGVEQGWWDGLKSCSGQSQLSLDELLGTPPARCDEVPWSLFGLSMAAWNGIFSIVLGGLWFAAYKDTRQ